jgi:magnesium-protoporphyrin IX monomethyl ester (oxidative) cyclase
MLWRFNGVYNPARQLADHRRPVPYQMRLPPYPTNGRVSQKDLFVLQPQPAKQSATVI